MLYKCKDQKKKNFNVICIFILTAISYLKMDSQEIITDVHSNLAAQTHCDTASGREKRTTTANSSNRTRLSGAAVLMKLRSLQRQI